MIPSPDQWFSKYQQSGDPADLAAVFDMTASKLLLLAIHLTGDELGAEDLVQSTFLKIIENASAYDASRPFLPWASTILANEARKAWRRGRLENVQDHVVHDRSDDPLRVAAEADMIDVLTGAIDGLDARYRAVVRMKVFHGMKPGEIASVLSISPELTRTRLSRGLKQLRSALPAALAGSMMVLIGGRGLARVREQVLEHAEVARSPAASVAVVSGSPIAWTAIAAATVFASSVFLAQQHFGPNHADALAPTEFFPAPLTEFAGVHALPLRADSAPLRGGGTQVFRTAMGSEAVDAPWTLSGTVHSAGSSPLAGAEVSVSILHGCDLERLPPCSTDELGRFRIDVDALRKLGDLGLLGASLMIEATAPGHWPHAGEWIDEMPPHARCAGEFTANLQLTPGRTVHAELRTPDGEPISGTASVRLVDLEIESTRSWRHFEIGHEVDVAVVGAGPWRFEATCDDGILSLPLGALPANGDLGELSVAEHHVVQGRFVVPGGHPVPHAMFSLQRIDATNPEGRLPSPPDGPVAPVGAKRGRSDASGHFRVTGLLPGDYSLRLEHGAIDPIEARFTTGDLPRDIQLEGQSLTVRTVDADGRLIPGLNLLFQWELGDMRRSGDLGINDRGGVFDFLIPFGSSWKFTSGNWRVRFPPQLHFAAFGESQAELEIVVDDRLDGGSLALRVFGHDGREVRQFELELHHLETDDLPPTVSSDELDALALPAGRYAATVRSPSDARDSATIFAPLELEFEVTPGSTTTRRVHVEPAGRVEFDIESPEGLLDPSSIYLQVLQDGRWKQVGGFTQSSDTTRVTPAVFDFSRSVRSIMTLPPERVRLRLICGEQVSDEISCVIRAGALTSDVAYFRR